MKTDLRIIFMGTPDFAVATLETILANNYQVVGVITAPDKPAGRGRKINESAVKQFAKKNDLNVLQPTNLKDPDFLESLKALQANVQVVVAFRMLPEAVWQMPALGTFNLHASLLPNYRGAAPINWALINGETETGVSTFFIDDKIDTGDMILQKKVAIEETDNVGTLHDKLMETGSRLVIDTLKLIKSGAVKTAAQQEHAELKDAHKLNRENCKIDWNDSVKNIHNKVRGLNPYPSAWCYLKNDNETLEIKIYETRMEKEDHQEEIGSIITTKKTLKVAAPDGYIYIETLKLPGKRKMAIIDLLNGYEFQPNANML
ncbi:methionyl-tRNA formyltransferase [Bizionia argentinensis JUB59]|uniref:Methionyl-tRNA formyltransferase n=1 Tax=Bizionia argentinensis JUB59 TaxID=1046627 RepID=G2ECF0_9FLAO|nr:methionyl-tRNA formyltransferase [Bizionia argentinensis]EGV43879.1 methionyl-tRNA formyltransferase [Bizionia argentinensis JUB59]